MVDSWVYLQAAIRDPNPVVFLENEILYGHSFPVNSEILSDDFVLPIGKAKIERAGKDVTLVSHTLGVTHCMQAAEILAKEGIEAEVINLRSIRPLDIETVIESLKKTNRVVTVEGGFPAFGVGSGTSEEEDYTCDNRADSSSIPLRRARNLCSTQRVCI